METDNLLMTSQMLQAILVASSALVGFAGFLIIEYVRLTRRENLWVKSIIGFIALIWGFSFISCVINIIDWFKYKGMFASDLDMALIWFYAQIGCFLFLFVVYILVSYFSTEK